MKRLSLFIMVLLLSFWAASYASAGPSFAVNTQATLTLGCDNINCSDGPLNLTVQAPDGTFLFTNKPMTKGVGYAYYSISSTNLTQTSTYNFFVASNNDQFSDTFEVRNTGKILQTSEAVLYVFFLLAMATIIYLLIQLIKAIPTNNPTNLEGELTGVNYIKYVKMPLWGLVWAMHVLGFYIIANVALTYLQDKFIGTFFFVLFRITMILSIPLLILAVWYLVIKLTADLMLGKDINHGFVGGSL